MLDTVKYVNSVGGEVVFTAFPIMCNTKRFREFTFALKNGKIYNYSGEQEIPLEIVMSADSSVKNNIFQTLEYDAIKNKFGRLYVNDSFIVCCFKSISSINKEKNNTIRMDLTFYAKNKDWITEKVFDLRSSSISSGLDFPHDYPFDYSSPETAITKIANTSIEEADIRLEFTNPTTEGVEVAIAGHSYIVDANIAAGEKLVVDTLEKSVYKGNDNLFRYTDDSSYIFKKIPSGISSVVWDGFPFKCTVYERRRIPLWI